MLADILGTERGEEDGGNHADDGQNRAKTYIADDNAAENCVDDGLAADLLSQLVGCVGCNVALQGLVVLEDLDNIGHLQRFGFLGADKGFGFVEGGNAEADQQGADGGNNQGDIAGSGQKCLIIGAAALGQQDDVEHHGHNHRHQIVECGRPDAEGRALARVIRHNGGNRLRRHIGGGVADDVDHVQQRERDQPHPLGGEAGEHRVEGNGLNQVARDQQHTQLAELGVDAVIHKGQQRVGDAVQNTGAGQDDANRGGGNAVADAGRIAGHTDERVDAHTDQRVAGVADDLPCFGAAVLYAVNF